MEDLLASTISALGGEAKPAASAGEEGAGEDDLYQRIDRKGLQEIFNAAAGEGAEAVVTADLPICKNIAEAGTMQGITMEDTWEASSIDQLFQGSQEANSLDQLFNSTLFAPKAAAIEIVAPDPEPEVDSSTSKKEEKDEKTRQQIAEEILSTEAVFVNALQVLDQQFITPLLLAHKHRETKTTDNTLTKRLSTDEVCCFPAILATVSVFR
jgi:hypothetical protein